MVFSEKVFSLARKMRLDDRNMKWIDAPMNIEECQEQDYPIVDLSKITDKHEFFTSLGNATFDTKRGSVMMGFVVGTSNQIYIEQIERGHPYKAERTTYTRENPRGETQIYNYKVADRSVPYLYDLVTGSVVSIPFRIQQNLIYDFSVDLGAITAGLYAREADPSKFVQGVQTRLKRYGDVNLQGLRVIPLRDGQGYLFQHEDGEGEIKLINYSWIMQSIVKQLSQT